MTPKTNQDPFFCTTLYEEFGGRLMREKGEKGVRFVVWAPSAKAVSAVGDFNDWKVESTPLQIQDRLGVWEGFVPGLKAGDRYKFALTLADGSVIMKADPFALQGEPRPLNASVIADLDAFKWEDAIWQDRMRRRAHEDRPLSIYEVHLGSWLKSETGFRSYKELAKRLVDYVKPMGYTHIELMPIQEHPLDESWGYQVTGFFAVTSRFGTPQAFQEFVNILHLNEIGVILDWVPAHFPSDDFALAHFDGTPLFEHEDPTQRKHPKWHTLVFNLERQEVRNFLYSSALFWLEKMHVDGLRVDAVSSLLYLDHEREPGEWTPNREGGRENLEAIDFFKTLNSLVHEKVPGALMIAEESTQFPGVTRPVSEGGLGFDLKWNMGWMNDTLKYFCEKPEARKAHHNHLTFGILYAFKERYLLPFSHDEVVHGKGSLLSKMPGDRFEQFAGLRLLHSYHFCQPGKKLLFMGGEIGAIKEWDAVGGLDWELLKQPLHQGVQLLVRELNEFYRLNNALWEHDFDERGFEWVHLDDKENSIISYQRKSSTQKLLCVHNFTPASFKNYKIPLKGIVMVKEAFNTDDENYGGSGCKSEATLLPNHEGVCLTIAPLATQIFHIQF